MYTDGIMPPPQSKNWANSKPKYSEKLCCSTETKDLITKDCIREFIEHNPEFKDVAITHDMILNRIAKYYLDRTEPEF